MANDAYHITSPDPEGKGALCVMKMALTEAKIKKNAKYYVNAHGTGTMANDIMEYNAIKEAFGEQLERAYVSSTKSLTGHCLGAAGSVELALSLILMNLDCVLPTQNSNTDIDEENNLNEKAVSFGTFEYVLSNSFAFAGNDASVILGKSS